MSLTDRTRKSADGLCKKMRELRNYSYLPIIANNIVQGDDMRKRKNPLMIVAISIAVLGIAVASLIGSHKNEPKKLVEEFYQLEQEGDFGSSWELFHSQMKKRFNKDQYIQTRAHVFMQDMKVESFTFEIGEMKKIHNWKAEQGAIELKEVYKITIHQTLNSQFGKFVVVQECFLAKEKGEWRLLWDYNQ